MDSDPANSQAGWTRSGATGGAISGDDRVSPLPGTPPAFDQGRPGIPRGAPVGPANLLHLGRAQVDTYHLRLASHDQLAIGKGQRGPEFVAGLLAEDLGLGQLLVGGSGLDEAERAVRSVLANDDATRVDDAASTDGGLGSRFPENVPLPIQANQAG